MNGISDVIGSLSTAAQNWYHTINPPAPVYTVSTPQGSYQTPYAPIPQAQTFSQGGMSTQTVLLLGAAALLVVVLVLK